MGDLTESATYTPAQLRAFEWLPEDGSLAMQNIHGAALRQLEKTKFVRFRVHPHGGFQQYGLTPSGIAERKRLVETGEIK